MRQLVSTMCDDAGIQARVAHEVAETSTLFTFVAAGLGIAVVPEPTASLGVPGVAHIPLDGAHDVPLIAAISDENNPVIQRSLTILKHVANQAAPPLRTHATVRAG